MKNDIIRQQETKVTTLDDSIANLKASLVEADRAKEQRDREIESLNRLTEGLRNKLDIADHSLQKKEDCRLTSCSDRLPQH